MKQKHSYRALWWVACALWLAMIFSQSTLTSEASAAESGGVLARLSTLLPFLTEHLLRKMAHFSEFFVLGCLLSQCMTSILSRPLLTGLLCALSDETIQLFSAGRAAMVQDVWIDFAGVTLAVLLTFGLRRLHRRKAA